MISNITIKNIKGYDAVGRSMDVNLLPDKINLVIAPNGFGKTSLMTAFESLTAGGLEVKDENKNQEDSRVHPFLSITLDGMTYVADETKNEITPQLATHTIHSRLGVYATAHRIGKAIPVTKYMDIQDIEVCKVVEKAAFKKISAQEKSLFGTKWQILSHSLEFMKDNLVFCSKLRDFSYAFNVFHTQVNRGAMLKECIEYIANYPGTTTALAQHYDQSIFDKIEADEHYRNFVALYCKHVGHDRLHMFIVFHELLDIYFQDPKAFRKACEYAAYVRHKNFVAHELSILNSTWKSLNLVEKGDKLYVAYPKARNISNGQRDLLTFIVDLIVFDSKMSGAQKGLLIIDEIFDYLDDANILVAQYYLTRILKKHKGNLYIIWLTHLAQDNFRSKILNHKVLNVVYLKPVRAVPNDCMKKFIATRQSLNKDDANQKELYNRISHYILHYSPTDIDLTEELRPYVINGTRASWGRRNEFHTYLIEELNKYLQDQEDYDPYAVAVSVRLKSEINIYRKLTTQEQKDAFEAQKETKKKFEKMEEDFNIPVPVSYYVIAAIHNDADHIYIDSSGNIPDASVVYKLEHLVVKNIVKELFGYQEGVAVTIEALQ